MDSHLSIIHTEFITFLIHPIHFLRARSQDIFHNKNSLALFEQSFSLYRTMIFKTAAEALFKYEYTLHNHLLMSVNWSLAKGFLYHKKNIFSIIMSN